MTKKTKVATRRKPEETKRDRDALLSTFNKYKQQHGVAPTMHQLIQACGYKDYDHKIYVRVYDDLIHLHFAGHDVEPTPHNEQSKPFRRNQQLFELAEEVAAFIVMRKEMGADTLQKDIVQAFGISKDNASFICYRIENMAR